MSPLIDEMRVRAVARAVASVPREAVETVEANDPQLLAVRRIASRHGRRAIAIVVANALVSYRLRVHGEDYWLAYAEWWEGVPPPRTSGDVIRAVSGFLRARRLAAHIEHKERRLLRASPVVEQLLAFSGDELDLAWLLGALKRALRASGYEKTLFFALKMAYYACKVVGVRPVNVESESTLIPLDRRIAMLTSASGMLRATPDRIYSELRREAATAWRMVAAMSGTPVLQLDALLWLPARGVEPLLRRGLLASARDEFARRLYELSRGTVPWQLAVRLASELLHRNPFLGS